MTQAEFTTRIVAMQDTLYRVSASLLPRACDREDAVQEVICRAWQQQARLRDDHALKAWVIRILINHCYTMLRRAKREAPTAQPPEPAAPAGADPLLSEGLANLPEKFRLPLVLHYIEGYSVEDITHILRLPAGTVKSRLHRGRQHLRTILGKLGEEVTLA